jgi:peptide/nickel transport system substrate-binding protein
MIVNQSKFERRIGMRNRNFMSIVIVVLFSIAIYPTAIQAEKANTLTIATQFDTESLDPAQVTSVESINAVGAFYDTLVTFKGGTGELEPALAKSWNIAKDGSKITFHLRKGVKFHDGTELTAEDVKYSFERLLATRLKAPGQKLAKLTSVEKLKVVDKYTFELGLLEPTPLFTTFTNPMGFGIVSRKFVEEHATEGDPFALNWMRDHVMGSGPWKLEKWSINEKLIMAKNTEYWGAKPNFDKLLLNVIRDASTAQMMLEKGDVDIAINLTMDQYKALENVKGLVVESFPTLQTVYINMNCSKKPFNNVSVRKALNFAVNKDELIKYVELGRATRMDTTLPKGMMGFNPAMQPKYEYNPEKAKNLLKEAGLSKDFETTLMCSLQRHAPFEDMLPYIISYLGDVGIKVKGNKLAWTTQFAKMKAKDYELALMTWNPYFPDPTSQALYYYWSQIWKEGRGWSFAFWENEKFDQLIVAADANMNVEERTKQYEKADQIVIEEAIAIPLYQTNKTIARIENIKNISWHPTLWYKKFTSIYRE